MTQAARKVLEQFDSLPDPERAEVLVELLRRAASTPHESPGDDDLTAAADEVFAELDRREKA
jgi:hypothetical protein